MQIRGSPKANSAFTLKALTISRSPRSRRAKRAKFVKTTEGCSYQSILALKHVNSQTDGGRSIKEFGFRVGQWTVYGVFCASGDRQDATSPVARLHETGRGCRKRSKKRNINASGAQAIWEASWRDGDIRFANASRTRERASWMRFQTSIPSVTDVSSR